MKNKLLGVFILMSMGLISSAEPIKSTKLFCSPDSIHSQTRCRCLLYHPKEEFCESSKAPLPSCCIATEPKSKVHLCSCCNKVYGSKRDIIDADERRSYQHIQ